MLFDLINDFLFYVLVGYSVFLSLLFFFYFIPFWPHKYHTSS